MAPVGASLVAELLGACLLSVASTFALCQLADRIGAAVGLLDEPDGQRKTHSAATPSVGGLAVLLPSLTISIIYLAVYPEFQYTLIAVIAAAVTVAIGTADDRFDLAPLTRAILIIPVIAAAFWAEPTLVLHSIPLSEFGTNLSIPLDPIAAPITLLVVFGFVNAVNLADGMNGQFFGSAMIWCLLLGWNVGLENGLPYFVVAGSAAVATYFNLREQLFAGSAGAYGLSVLVGLGAIGAFRHAHGAMPVSMPVCWFWLPVVDCLRLIGSRILSGQSPFVGGRDHFHHRLNDKVGKNYALATYLGLLALPGIAAQINERAGIATLVICLGIYTVLMATAQIPSPRRVSSQQ